MTVEFLAPREMTATRSELSIALGVRGGEPDRLDLYVDEHWVARLDSATYRWDTRDWPEGEHTLTARVRVGEQVFTSPGRKVVVDRSPPRAVARQPMAASQTVSPSDPFLVSFSEPLRPSALESLWLEARLSTGPTFTIKPLALSEDRKTLVFRHEVALSPPVTLFITPRGSWRMTWAIGVPWRRSSGTGM
ncbi:hypothetical protein [Melittangium boletus]|uniref:hypothetical protein n=1 Tax=Melittangium boletus TaxID=83453 RepID=UPI003DA6548C